ncbi:malto-oligosyltrehalose trehalohydrolase [Sphaerisporangium siamense]|uniref:Malto-oligosyltrehalose trehalohydrolase n=1 Tax=Sphaerisporangium siamense TaxID=795645 RepID=A0A7W7GEP8_9ACTN|nr:malto-oligosyltrehalose trehalohydrolase [Sphaerisporangium siamense]MBB4705699.1 maltooligosyltrehalose trehalohydrolase [Sphaerisporangium siamense]GII82915.1 malto-oligosyltrehalose trehalohydrolase [Sphaerisporangium siamense]
MFEVWAPTADRVEVEIHIDAGKTERHAMTRGRDGWWTAQVAGAGHDTDYAFSVDGGEAFPDPRTRRQPSGVFGPSRLYDHDRFPWNDRGWRGRALPGSVIYEVHVGTFTPEGTFDAAAGRIGHLVDLGVDFVELMPVPPVPGRHNWGYDGVDLYAVHEEYGGPDGLKRFVDACHRAGLGVLLDVVYNHLGPSGNFLAPFGPYFHESASSFWGQAVNLDGRHSDEVRRYFIGNAVQWLRDYHIDGLRLDAVHALHDNRAVHFLEELATEVDALSTALGRPLTLIAEADMNDPRLVTPRDAGGYGLAAAWNDDVHHALHAAVSGERHGYYGDFGSMGALAKVLTHAYFHDGTYSSFRGRGHGRPVDRLRVPGHRFVCCVQNHDQIGNRAAGDRLPADALKLGAGLLLTSPFTPMLFMGEEWGASTPFLFFTDHVEPHLAQDEGERREREFVGFGYDDWGATAPDPQDEATFHRSKLDWTEPAEPGHREVLAWYCDLIALRKAQPALADPRLDRVSAEFSEEGRWIVVHRGPLRVAANLGEAPVTVPVTGRVLLASDAVTATSEGTTLPPRSLAVLDPS